jgi:hypothetical protein
MSTSSQLRIRIVTNSQLYDQSNSIMRTGVVAHIARPAERHASTGCLDAYRDNCSDGAESWPSQSKRQQFASTIPLVSATQQVPWSAGAGVEDLQARSYPTGWFTRGVFRSENDIPYRHRTDGSIPLQPVVACVRHGSYDRLGSSQRYPR